MVGVFKEFGRTEKESNEKLSQRERKLGRDDNASGITEKRRAFILNVTGGH